MCEDVCVGVDEIKVSSWLFRGLVNIMTKHNGTFNLCLRTKLAMTLVVLLTASSASVAANLAFSSFHCCLVIVCLLLYG